MRLGKNVQCHHHYYYYYFFFAFIYNYLFYLHWSRVCPFCVLAHLLALWVSRPRQGCWEAKRTPWLTQAAGRGGESRDFVRTSSRQARYRIESDVFRSQFLKDCEILVGVWGLLHCAPARPFAPSVWGMLLSQTLPSPRQRLVTQERPPLPLGRNACFSIPRLPHSYFTPSLGCSTSSHGFPTLYYYLPFFLEVGRTFFLSWVFWNFTTTWLTVCLFVSICWVLTFTSATPYIFLILFVILSLLIFLFSLEWHFMRF